MSISFSDFRDDLGTSVKMHTSAERKAFLRRNPNVDAESLPPVLDRRDSAPAFSHYTAPPREYGAYFASSFPARGALLADPSTSLARREPTRPVARPEPAVSLYRSATHEVGHLLACFAADVAVARITVVANGDRLGEVKHADPSTDEDRLAIAVAGEAAEIVAFGQARTAGLEVDRTLARQAAERLTRKNGGDVEAIIDAMRQRVINMLRGEEHTMRHMAYKLVRRKTLEFDAIDIALDRAFTTAEQYAAKRVQRKQTGRKLTDAEMHRLVGENGVAVR